MTRLTLQILVVTVFVSQFSRAQDWINVVADPSKFVKNAGAMEFRFFAIDKNGKGEGKMAYATQISFDKKKNAVELENYTSEPVRLNQLKLEVRK